jgi:hypothetical protein
MRTAGSGNGERGWRGWIDIGMRAEPEYRMGDFWTAARAADEDGGGLRMRPVLN